MGRLFVVFSWKSQMKKKNNAFVVGILEVISWELYMVENALLKSFFSPFHPSPPSL